MKKSAVQGSHCSTTCQLGVRTPLERRPNHCWILQYEMCATVYVHIERKVYNPVWLILVQFTMYALLLKNSSLEITLLHSNEPLHHCKYLKLKIGSGYGQHVYSRAPVTVYLFGDSFCVVSFTWAAVVATCQNCAIHDTLQVTLGFIGFCVHCSSLHGNQLLMKFEFEFWNFEPDVFFLPVCVVSLCVSPSCVCKWRDSFIWK